MKRNFNEWLSKFKYSISDYTYYVDFQKVYTNVDKIKIELNILNSLIGSKKIEEDFENIILKYPDTLECIPILLAVRAHEIYVHDELNEYLFQFDKMVYSISDYKKFMRKTGLFDLLQNHIINNLYDYVLGVEVGLDSNGRKNRGGHLMENLVESYIKKAGYVKGVNYFKEMYLDQIEERWNVDLSAMSADHISSKRFDFVIKTANQIYVIETNFYGGKGGGSKLNETARSYKMLAQEAENVDGVTFMWITDGTAWKSARRNLEETFNTLDTIYNLDDLEHGVLKNLS
ncbi:MAG: type II restriction endonuclease [Candidatus Faecenecus gallistercoris]|nr:type II restriction endonuclease [Candidatus Faecenecus gallistercoris]